MRNHAKSRRHAPRLLGTAAALLGLLVLALIGTGGAGAAPGDTDLSITKTGAPNPVVSGENLTYTITVHNPGTLPATNVVVTDTLPSGTDYVSATGGVCQRDKSKVTCDLGQVNAGTDPVVTIVVKVTKKEGTLSNTATVASPEDTVLANNSATATTTVSKKPGKAKGKKKAKASCGAPTMTGTPGNDVINGTSGGDVIVTYDGNDQVFAGGGADLVCTGAGADVVSGDAGKDTIIGGGGPDKLKGGDSADLLKGKAGKDKLKGQGGNDTLDGGKKKDKCKGGPGRDTLLNCP